MSAIKTLPLVLALLTMADFAFAQTWTQTGAPSNGGWYGIASSADGNKLVAVRNNSIYLSTNSGVTWTPSFVPTGKQWQGIASSADGVKLAAADANFGGIFTSTNSGLTWISNSVPNNYWWSLASSADGTKLAAAVGLGVGPIFTSTNSGMTWRQTSSSSNYWSSVASSADGTKLAAVQQGNYPDFQGRVYTSTNSGTTWTQTSAIIQSWKSVASSADGNILIAAGISSAFGGIGGLYTSTNSGVTWISNSVSKYIFNVSSVAISAEGDKMVAVNFVENSVLPPGFSSIYTSTDSGATWQTNNVSATNWQAVASSADGNKLVAATWGGGIWTSQRTSSPQLNITPLSTILTLSWLIPSTNFVLQQSADLLSWAGVTNPPVLNLTNLQNQVTLPPSGSSGFYRLKTP
jgi:hypothetical protein